MISRLQFLALMMLIPLFLSAQEQIASFPFIKPKTESAPVGIGIPSTIGRSGAAREKLLNLSGVFHLGHTNARSISRIDDSPRIETRSRDLYWGLDLILRSYILDPRFIALTFEPSFLRGSGNFDESETRRGSNGRNFYLDFLPNNYYPFRFHWIKQDIDYTQVPISSATTIRRSIGFD